MHKVSGGVVNLSGIGTIASTTALFSGNLPTTTDLWNSEAEDDDIGSPDAQLIVGEITLFELETVMSSALFATMRAYDVFSTMSGEISRTLTGEKAGNIEYDVKYSESLVADVNIDQGINAALATLCVTRLLGACWHITGVLSTAPKFYIQELMADNILMLRDVETIFVATEAVLRHQHSQYGAEAVMNLFGLLKKVERFLCRLSLSVVATADGSDSALLHPDDTIFGIHCSTDVNGADTKLHEEKPLPQLTVGVVLIILLQHLLCSYVHAVAECNKYLVAHSCNGHYCFTRGQCN